MFKNYVKVALRNLLRHKGYSFINVFGLAVGIACCLLIALFVRDELSYDRFHENGDRIYRLGSSTVGWPYGQIIETEYPEVEEVVYMRSWPTFSINHEGEHLFETMRYADADFFRVFSFPLLEGDPATALAQPYTLVLSERLARKLFGDAQAVGQPLVLGDSLQFTVTGVAHVPRQSHIQFDALLSFETLRARDSDWYEQQMASGWLNLNVVNYVLLREGADAAALEAKIRDLPHERAGEILTSIGSDYKLRLEPLNRIYLHAKTGNSVGPKSDVAYVYLLGAIGLFLLVLAGVNFVNLATARSAERAREVGVRKALGSARSLLVRQFLVESLMTCGFAVCLAIGFAVLALPFFNGLAAKQYGAADLFTPGLLLALLVITLGVGFLAGLYPALVLSSFRPIEVLKGQFVTGGRGNRLRQGLVVFQFVISGVLLVGTLAVVGQVRYMQEQDLGFDEEQVLVLDAGRAPGAERERRTEVFKEALAAHPAVERVSATDAVPGRLGWPGQLSFPEGMAEGESVSLEYVATDHDFVRTMGLEIVAGRDFDASLATDAERSVLINEAAVTAAGWSSAQEAIGKRFTSPGSGKPDGTVIGVVKDYHHRGLQERIGPMMFGIDPGALFALRVSTSDAASVVAHVEQTWTEFFDGYPAEHVFLDDDFAQQYGQEQRLTRIFATFAGLAVLIACLGLFGLASFMAMQRRREIGVRKVLGASVVSIAGLLSRQFLRLVLAAMIIAAPIAWYAMHRWLEGFAYRTTLGPGIFLLAGGAACLIALLTVSYQSIRAATADPVKSLRAE